MIAWHHALLVPPLFVLAFGCADDASEGAPQGDPTSGAGGSTTATSSTSSSTSTSSTGEGGTGGGSVAVECNMAPCGGDVVGEWSYSDACSNAPWIEDVCAGTDPPVSRRSRYVQYPKGSVIFDATGVATIEKSIVAGWEFVIPKACLFGAQQCQNAVQGDGVTCTEDGADCLCSSIAEGPVETGSDPYVTDGSSMVIGAGDEAATLDYCVSGDVLELVHPETAEATFLTRR